MPPTLRVLGLALLLALLPGAARAWSIFGHELIAELAERRLSPATRAAAHALLRDEGASLVAVAGWADRVRDDPAYAWSDRLHYVNFPRDRCEYLAGRDCPGGDCVVGAVQRFRAELGDAALPRERRVEALKFLVHFVGDIHQPLHCGFGHDKGGNTFQVNVDGHGSNLHRVWDGLLIASSGRDRTAQLAALDAGTWPAAGTLDPVAWTEESCRIVMQDGFYPRRGRLPASYLERQRPVAEARMRLAAVRLAALLEDALAAR